MLVHELKSPLTSLQITTEVLSETAIEDPYKEVAFNISSSVDNLKTKVDGLLDIAKGEVGLFKLDYKNTNLDDLFRRLETELSRIASVKMKKLEFHVPADIPEAMIDGEKLSQVIWNLVDNAMKFTPEGGVVIIKVRIEQDERLIVSVIDNGHGMSAEKQSNIFKPLIDNPHDISDSQRLTGLGIGLILSKMIIDLHGGYIKVESQLGKGSIFTFSVPLSPNGKINMQKEGDRHEGINN
jgi:signal transduction histidine kinase